MHNRSAAEVLAKDTAEEAQGLNSVGGCGRLSSSVATGGVEAAGRVLAVGREHRFQSAGTWTAPCV
jgi:hypothetical protein